MTTKLFLCHHDNDARYCDELSKHLKPAERERHLTLWHRRRVLPGQDVRREIDARLEDADIIVLLISADLLSCDYCWGIEVAAAIQRHRAERSVLVPLIVRACTWELALSDLRPIPATGIPVVPDVSKIDDTRFFDAAAELIQLARTFATQAAQTGGHSEVTAIEDILTEVRRLREAADSPSAAAEALFRLNAGLRYSDPSSDTTVFIDTDPTREVPLQAIEPLRRACERAFADEPSVSEASRPPDGQALPAQKDPAPPLATGNELRIQQPSLVSVWWKYATLAQTALLFILLALYAIPQGRRNSDPVPTPDVSAPLSTSSTPSNALSTSGAGAPPVVAPNPEFVPSSGAPSSASSPLTRVRLTAEPAGAHALVDGHEIPYPWTFEVSQDKPVNVSVTKLGFRSTTVTIDGSKTDISVKLLPNTPVPTQSKPSFSDTCLSDSDCKGGGKCVHGICE